MHTRCRSLHLSIVGAPSRAVAHSTAKLKGANQQNIRCIASSLKFLWYGSMEWNMEENFSMERNMEWKIFSMEWKWNGRKLRVWNMEKSSSIPYHALGAGASLLLIRAKKVPNYEQRVPIKETEQI